MLIYCEVFCDRLCAVERLRYSVPLHWHLSLYLSLPGEEVQFDQVQRVVFMKQFLRKKKCTYLYIIRRSVLVYFNMILILFLRIISFIISFHKMAENLAQVEIEEDRLTNNSTTTNRCNYSGMMSLIDLSNPKYDTDTKYFYQYRYVTYAYIS